MKSSRPNVFAFLCACIASTAVAAGAESPAAVPAAPPVEDLVAEALRRSPELAALRARVAAAREEVAPAGALPDPMLEGMLQDVGFPDYTVGEMEMSMVGLELRQGIPFPGKRGSRREAGRALVAQRARELAAAERSVSTEVRSLYARLYAIDRARESLAAARELLEMLSATVAVRYSAGEAEMEAQIKSQLERSRLDERLEDLVAERAEVVAALHRRLDRPADTPLGDAVSLPDVQVPPEPWEALVLQRSPRVAVRVAAVAAAERRVDVARRDQAPDLFLGLGYASRGSLDHLVTLRVGAELPLWRGKKQRPLVRASEHELEMERQDLRDEQAMARAESARLAAAWRRSESQVRLYTEAILPQTSAALDAARAGYVAGRSDFSTVVEDFELWIEARIELASREAERFTTWAEIEALVAPATQEAGRP